MAGINQSAVPGPIGESDSGFSSSMFWNAEDRQARRFWKVDHTWGTMKRKFKHEDSV